MLKKLSYILVLAAVALLASCRSAKPAGEVAANDNLIIFYDPEAGNSELLKAAEKYGSKILYVYKNINGIAVTVPNGKSVLDAISHYEKIKGVLSVTKDEVMLPE